MSAPFVVAPTLANVPHGFFGRRGGVSSGDLASLNCGLGSGDDPALIAENRHRATEAVLPGAALAGLYQVHGNCCVIVDAPCKRRPLPRFCTATAAARTMPTGSSPG